MVEQETKELKGNYHKGTLHIFGTQYLINALVFK